MSIHPISGQFEDVIGEAMVNVNQGTVHHNPWFVYFLPQFYCGLYCRAVSNAEWKIFTNSIFRSTLFNVTTRNIVYPTLLYILQFIYYVLL